MKGFIFTLLCLSGLHAGLVDRVQPLEQIYLESKSEEDLIVYVDGNKVEGELEQVPALKYAFGEIEFDIDELVVLVFNKGRALYITQNGQQSEGKIGSGQLIFSGEALDPETVMGVCIDTLIEQEPKLHAVLNNGDRFPVAVADEEIAFIGEPQTLSAKDIFHIKSDGGLHGQLLRHGKQGELQYSIPKNTYVTVHLSGTPDKAKIPWKQISAIKMEGVLERMLDEGRRAEELEKTDDIALADDLEFSPIEENTHIFEEIAELETVEIDGTVWDLIMDGKPISNSDYAAFIEATGHKPPLHWVDGTYPKGKGNAPVTNLKKEDANSYRAWITTNQ